MLTGTSKENRAWKGKIWNLTKSLYISSVIKGVHRTLTNMDVRLRCGRIRLGQSPSHTAVIAILMLDDSKTMVKSGSKSLEDIEIHHEHPFRRAMLLYQLVVYTHMKFHQYSPT